MSNAIIHDDEPTQDDRLNRNQYAIALARLAEACDTPMVIGLYGGWGVGKTSLMRLIEAKLQRSRTRTVWFDPWRHQFDESPALALLHTVVDTLSMHQQQEIKKLLTVIAGAFGSLLLKVTTTLSLGDIDELGKRYEEERFRVREARVRLRKHFEELIQKARGREGRRIVFLIDDLDRCLPAQVLTLLESLKLYLNLTGCVYFLAVDPHALERSVHFHYKDSELSETSYLDKIIQLPFTIPPIPPESMEEFVTPLLVEELQPCRSLLVKGLGDNPREVKRFINTLTLNHELASGLNIPEYDPVVLAVLLLIQHRSPGLYRLLARQLTSLQSLQQEAEDTKPLWDEYLARDERLREVLKSTPISGNAVLERYIYLTHVAGVTEAVKPEPPSEEGVRRLLEEEGRLELVCAAHRKWIESDGRQGRRADLSGAHLRGADLRGARLQRAGLRTANLHRANLAEAELSWADLRWADLRGAEMQSADLTGTDLSGSSLQEANLTRAILRAANASGATMAKANLSEADLVNANLRGAELRNVDLRRADFKNAKLDEAHLQGANLRGASNLAEEQLGSATTDDSTILPDGSRGPFQRDSGAHLPATTAKEKLTR